MSETMMAGGTRKLQIWRGDLTSGELVDYELETDAMRSHNGKIGNSQIGIEQSHLCLCPFGEMIGQSLDRQKSIRLGKGRYGP